MFSIIGGSPSISQVKKLVFILVTVYILLNTMAVISYHAVFTVRHKKSEIIHSLHVDLGLPQNNSRQLVNISSNCVFDCFLKNKTETRKMSAADFWKGKKTGNPLIDDYGKNNLSQPGELGREVKVPDRQVSQADLAMKEHGINTAASDMIPLNRLVPDSRIQGCDKLQYNDSLPAASIIVPFYNELLSLLLRTVYSIINRTPRKLVKEIILVDDASTSDNLKKNLEVYINENFPGGLVRLVRLPERTGLIKARMVGSRAATGDVLVFFDSHMEVNIDWLQPLLKEITRDRTNVALATLDYIRYRTFKYDYYNNTLNRYGWDWRLDFFETSFRDDQIGPNKTDPRPGACMVGAAFAIDRNYFFELGGYDEKMKVWGGENLEMSWRVWLCGGRLLHVPCSRIGHVARGQPYSFPGGRQYIKHFNYKRAIDVWMGNYSRIVYHMFPDMQTMDVGDISSRLALKSKLKCKDFAWYLQNVWPELNVPYENVIIWGQVVNNQSSLCLDSDNLLYPYNIPLKISNCTNQISKQAFSLTTDNLLKASLQCVVCSETTEGAIVRLNACTHNTTGKWTYLQDHSIVHQASHLCLDVSTQGPVLNKCQTSSKSQKWEFRPYIFSNYTT